MTSIKKVAPWLINAVMVAIVTNMAPILAAETSNFPEDTDEIVIEDETEITEDELVIEDETTISEEQDTELKIEEEIEVIDDDIDLVIDEDLPGDEPVVPSIEDEISIEESTPDMDEALTDTSTSPKVSFKIDDLWAEYGVLPNSSSEADKQHYLHGLATARWIASAEWEFQASVRVDGYYQSGGENWDSTKLDYDDSFVRYQDEGLRLTLGAEKVIWGRIDEIPPTDRMSTHDFSRFILDDLSDRRRAAPVIRLESFHGNSKLDVVFLPLFREAELPGEKSVWYPVNKTTGQIIGLASTPAISALIQSSTFVTDTSDSDGGFGIRYSSQKSDLDYAITVQKTRQSLPYFRLNSVTGVFEAQYPRSWLVGGDLEFEAHGATWRFEGAWLSDTPVTRTDITYTTTHSLSWGGAVEFYPGDGDTRINLQLTGINLINAPNVIDRTEIYSFNGSFEMPFAHDRWRAKGRFYIGLDEYDLYLNPEISFIGWEPHEIYLQAHYFDGDAGTPGGFHQDHSLLTLGWRTKF